MIRERGACSSGSSVAVGTSRGGVLDRAIDVKAAGVLGGDPDANDDDGRHRRRRRARCRVCRKRSSFGPLAHKFRAGVLQGLSISAYLISWVANGELLQGIANGSVCPGGVPYDKPASITWYSYNFMISSFLIVCPYVKLYRRWTLRFYVTRIWAGRIGWRKAALSCAAVSYMLLALNVLMILGLECIAVSLSNAIYQLQTPLTVGLSVWWLGDSFITSEAIGIAASLVGVALIVFPPLWNDGGADPVQQHGEEFLRAGTCSVQSAATLVGTMATLLSAAIGSVYLVSWRIFSERKGPVAAAGALPDRLEGFVDTHMTLAMIGLCNLALGWPVLPALHWLGFEPLELPPSASHWLILNVNGMVEYAFDASCAVAVYMTSPLLVAITAPLTILLSLMADQMLYGPPAVPPGSPANAIAAYANADGGWVWTGSAIIVLGVVLLETKPDLSKYRRRESQKDLIEEGALVDIEKAKHINDGVLINDIL